MYPIGGRSLRVVALDGSLFVTDDGNGTIWRVSYHGNARSR
jgi:glucose/arabinose dehydrogenase